jgi:hypothetical protein
MRLIRRLLNPILKLFFNPNPLIRALNIQARLNAEALAREAERDRQQAEWNALHYEILHRVVTEISRVTLEVQNVSMRIESLGAKVDFNERRVRGIEGAIHQARPAGRREEGRREEGRRDVQEAPPPQVVVQAAEGIASEPPSAVPGPGQPTEGTRRRRRRRRGRRGPNVPAETIPGGTDAAALEVENDEEGPGEDEVVGLMTDVPAAAIDQAAVAPSDADGADGDEQEELEAISVGETHEGFGFSQPDERRGESSEDDRAASWEHAESEHRTDPDGTHGDETDRTSHGTVAEQQTGGVVEEDSVVVVAEAPPRREDPIPAELVVEERSASSDNAAVEEPASPTEDPPKPAPPERRDFEPTDR